MPPHIRRTALACFVALCLFAAGAARAQASALPSPGGKLLLTGGVSSIDGAAGGGLTPWAVTGSYATDGEIGGTAHLTRAVTQNYTLSAYGAAFGFKDRIEVSVAHQDFDASVVVPDSTLKLDIVGVKLKLAGDAVLDADTLMPQIAVGAQFKHVDPGTAVGAVLDSVSAKRSGVDLYISATKLFLGRGVLLNATLRATRANQIGLLGFASADKSGYSLQPECSAALLLSKNIVVGVEYRAKPDNLKFAGAAFHEDDWKDLFVAWAPSKRVSLTAAYVDLGNIVGNRRQTGAYVSAQIAF
jgi:hypothetical protein